MTDPADLDVELVTVETATTAVVKGLVAANDLANFFDDSFGVLGDGPRPPVR